MRALIYVRLSSLTDASLSPQRQEDACREYAQLRGWEVAEVLRDLDVSGSDKGLRLDRPGLVAIRQQWQPGDVVVFASLDRAARNVLDFLTFADEAKAAGVSLVSVREQLDMTTPEGRMMATMLATTAEWEAARIAERVKAGVRSVRTAERHIGRVPYGYRSVPHPGGAGRALEPDPQAAAEVRSMAEAILGGQTTYEVAKSLNARKVSTSSGSEWTHRTVRQVLVGDAALGRITIDGDPLRGDDGLPKTVWTPLLTPDQATRLRATLQHGPRRPGRQHGARLLSGLAVCAGCGDELRLGTGRGGVAIYRCPRSADGKQCRGRVTIKADHLDQYVTDAFLEAVGSLPATVAVETAPSSADMAAVVQAIDETTRAMAATGADVPALVERLTVLKERQGELAQLPPEPATELVHTGRTLAQEWAECDVRHKQGWLRSAMDEVVVYPVRSRSVLDRTTDSRIQLVWVLQG